MTVLKLSYPQESGSSRFVENDWLIVSHDWLDSIYELNLGKAIYEITEFQNEFFAPFDFIPGTHALFALTDPNDDWGDLRVALYDAVSNKLTISNVPFEISTSSNSIITKDKAVFYYNDGDDGSLSCQFVHYKVTEDGNVEFED